MRLLLKRLLLVVLLVRADAFVKDVVGRSAGFSNPGKEIIEEEVKLSCESSSDHRERDGLALGRLQMT